LPNLRKTTLPGGFFVSGQKITPMPPSRSILLCSFHAQQAAEIIHLDKKNTQKSRPLNLSNGRLSMNHVS